MKRVIFGLVAIIGVTIIVACQKTDPATPGKSASHQGVSTPSDKEHEHAVGSHGGAVVAIGRESYHAEFVFENSGAIRVIMLQADESKIQEVERQSFTAYVTPHGETKSVAIQFEPMPQEGDAPEKTSQFVAQLPAELAGRDISGTIPNLKIGPDRFRIAFESPKSDVASHEPAQMPSKVADEAERELYLTPGGAYTTADIEANGKLTASQKFKGFQAKHDTKPKVGERICPVTDTKANSQCSWVINGQTYEFCCPPCVDEFLKLARTNPAAIKGAADYVKLE